MFLFFALVAFLTASFVEFIIIFLLIFVHELGHFLTAVFFKIEPDRIYIYPFGGISKFNIRLNERIERELLILLLGPISQFVFALILIRLPFFNHYDKIIKIYNYTILGFNLLPIYPLDGGRILNILLSLVKSFRKSLLYTLIISYIVIIAFSIIILLKEFSISSIILINFLIYKVYLEWKNRSYVNDNFLLERYLYDYKFKKRKYVNNIDEFMKNKKHIININGVYYTEKQILSDKFRNKY